MNIGIFMGRLTHEPVIRNTPKTVVAEIRVAVPRKFKQQGQPEADFFNFVALGRVAEFIEKYLHKGTKVVITCHEQNNNYVGKDGKTVYQDQRRIDSIEFAESKHTASVRALASVSEDYDDGPITLEPDNFDVTTHDDEVPYINENNATNNVDGNNVAVNVDDEELPFM